MNNFLNLQEVDQEQALHLTKFFIRSNQNVFFFGRRGIGKTFIAMQAAKECNLKINYINLSVIERPDLAGYPNMNTPGETISFKSPHFLPSLLENAKPDSVILFDEIDKAPAEVTAPLLEILQFRRVNGKSINAAGCILTGNLANEGAYSNVISSALLDRGAKYVLTFNFEKWIDWAKANNVHDLILGFLRSNPALACGKVDDTTYASPSPRGWTLASEALDKAKELKILDIDTVVSIISGFVGNSAGLQFKIWYEYYRKYENFVQSLIDTGTMKLDFSSLNVTEKAVFVISCCQHAKQKALIESSKSKPKFACLDNLCNFFLINNVDKELQTMGLYNSFDFDLVTKHNLYKNKNFFDLFTRLTDNISIKK